MKRREFIKGGAAALGAMAGVRAFAGESRPNVLLVLVDQMRQPMWFPEDARFKNLERLKSRGMEFTSHFVSAVPCSPSRACLMTGLHMDGNGVHDNIYPGVQPSLDPGIRTLGHMFRDAGYDTPWFGKWHLTSKADYQAMGGLGPYGFDWVNPRKGGVLALGLMTDPGYTGSALDWLKDNAGGTRPWFLTLSLINPHDICSYPRLDVPPLLVPDVTDRLPGNWDDDLEGKPRCQTEYQGTYAANAGSMRVDDEKVWRQYLDYYYYLYQKIDALLGRVLDTLEKTGAADNTIVIFTSDHGDMGGSHRLRSKGPCVYRENVNVPLVVSWPGRIAPGSRTDALSQNVDLFPTLAGMIKGKASSGLPGKDLSPLMTGQSDRDPSERVLFSFTSNIHIETGAKRMGRPGITSPHNIRAIREKRWVYARYFDPAMDEREYELYDTLNDPLEMHNLAGDPGYRNIEKEMADKLSEAEREEMRPA